MFTSQQNKCLGAVSAPSDQKNNFEACFILDFNILGVKKADNYSPWGHKESDTT